MVVNKGGIHLKRKRAISNMVKYVTLFMITLTFLLNYSPITSHACSCFETGTVSEELARSAAVFSGEVVDMLDKNKGNLTQSSGDPIAVLFEVEESWKGINQTQVIVYTARDSTSCGYEFSLNNKYLVYAHESNGELKADICTRTTLLSSAEQDIAELGFGEIPTKQVSLVLDAHEDKDEEQKSTTNFIYISLLIVGLLLVPFYIMRRKRVR